MTSILIFTLLFAQQAPLPTEKCTLAGTAVDSITGLPLAKVELVAENVAGKYLGASTITDAAGRFQLVDIAPGQYRLAARRNGYLETHFGAKRSSTTGSILTLSAGQQMDGLEIKLTPFGVIAGTVRDSDGEPIAGAQVEIYSLSYNGGRRSIHSETDAITDDLGQYRISSLSPGKYYVSAAARSRDDPPTLTEDHSPKSNKPPEAPILTFYPGTADPSTAKAVEVNAGTRATGIDVTLIRSRLYKIFAHIDARPGFDVSASLTYAADGFGRVGKSRTVNANGDIEIPDVPPGTYVMHYVAHETQKPFDGVIVMSGGGRCESSIPLSVEHSDLEGIRVSAAGCAVVTGHVSIDDGKEVKPSGGFTWVQLDPGAGNDGGVFLKQDGSFELHCAPGTHILNFTGLPGPRGLYVKSIRSANQDVLHNGFTTSGSEQVQLDIVLATGGGNVEGVVSNADDKPLLGATVVLIPSDPALRSWPDLTRTAITDQSGHFNLRDAAPGEYKLFSWSDIEDSSWFDPETMKDYEGRGQPVTIKAKDSQTINLHVIP